MPETSTVTSRIAGPPSECECAVFLDCRGEGREHIWVETTDCPIHSPELPPAFITRDA